jgi:hypothetical protein
VRGVFIACLPVPAPAACIAKSPGFCEALHVLASYGHVLAADAIVLLLLLLQVLQAASERVFVPLTVGGGIRGFSAQGKDYPALQVASEYFRWERMLQNLASTFFHLCCCSCVVGRRSCRFGLLFRL